MIPLQVIRAMARVFSMLRGPVPILLVPILFSFCRPANAASNVIFGLTLSGANITSVRCPSTAYLNCYKLTLSKIDAFGLTTGSGLRTIVNPNATNPTSALWASDDTINFQIGNTLNNQTGSVGISMVTAGFTRTYLAPEYCVTGCSVNTAFTSFPAANTVIYNTVSEGPSGGPANSYPLSLAALINAGNGAGFAGFGTPGIQGDTFQFNIHVQSTLGNKSGDALVTVDVQQAATAIMSNVLYSDGFGTVVGLPFSATQPVTANPFPGTVNYNQGYTFTPQFTQFSNSTGTLGAYISIDFAPAMAAASLRICDATTNTTAAVCTPLSKSAATPTTIGTSLANNGAFSHYLGLVVAEGTGYPGNATTGTPNATVTLVFSIP